MTLVQFGHGVLLVVGAIGVTAGVLAGVYPQHSVPLGATVAVCAALGTYLGRYLPSASPTVNANALAAVTATGASVTIQGTK